MVKKNDKRTRHERRAEERARTKQKAPQAAPTPNDAALAAWEFDKKQILSYVPMRWFADPVQATVLYSAYTCLLPHRPEFQRQRRVDLGDAVVVFAWGQLWRRGGEASFRATTNVEGSIALSLPRLNNRKTDEGAWLIVLQPYNTGNPATTWAELRLRRHAVAGLVSAEFGLPTAYQLEFENEAAFSTNDLTYTSPEIGIRSELFSSPLCTVSRLQTLADVSRRISTAAPDAQQRYAVALHWYDLGNRAEGIESFLSLWIAIEALTMLDSNIGPLKAAVARAYGMDPKRASQRFGLGRMAGFRGLLLHGQARVRLGSLHRSCPTWLLCSLTCCTRRWDGRASTAPSSLSWARTSTAPTSSMRRLHG